MSDKDAHLAELWLAFQENRISSDDWQRLLAEEIGLRRYVRRARAEEMAATRRLSHRQARLAYLREG